MDNGEFYNESEINKKSRFEFDKRILVAIVIIVLIGLIILFYSLKSNKYSLEVEAPSIMYIDEPLDIAVELKGSEKNVQDSTTSFYTEDEGIIEIFENEFSGKSGVMPIKPLALGKDKIHIISTIGADKYSKVLAKKTIPIVVCPKFDENLLSSKIINIKRRETQNLNINFGETECSQIITYESQNKNIAQVSTNGEVKGVFKGQTQILIQNGSSNLVVYVNVID